MSCFRMEQAETGGAQRLDISVTVKDGERIAVLEHTCAVVGERGRRADVIFVFKADNVRQKKTVLESKQCVDFGVRSGGHGFRSPGFGRDHRLIHLNVLSRHYGRAESLHKFSAASGAIERMTLAPNLSCMLNFDAISMARSTRFPGDMRPRKAKYFPPPSPSGRR